MLKKIYYCMKNAGEVLKGIVFSMLTLRAGKRERFVEETDKEVLILGNGPSLNDVDIERIIDGNTDVVCVNFFPIKDQRFFEMKPQYLCLLDPVFFQKSATAEDKKAELFETLEKVDWPMKIICIQGRKLPVNNQNISYSWINGRGFTGMSLKSFRYFLYRKNLTNCGMQNVVIGALYYFVSKKVRRIYLAGVDMSEFKQISIGEDNEIYILTQHSYGEEKIKYSDTGILKKGDLYILLRCYVTMFEQFRCLQEYAMAQNVEVLNLSPNSYIDVFEKNAEYLVKK